MVLNDDSYVVYDLKSGLVWHSIGGKYLSAKQQQTTASTTLTFLQQYEWRAAAKHKQFLIVARHLH